MLWSLTLAIHLALVILLDFADLSLGMVVFHSRSTLAGCPASAFPHGDRVPAMGAKLKSILLAGLLWAASLIAGAAALLLAEFGAPPWAFGLLLAWLLTLGLPTLLAVLLLAASWRGPSFQAYLLSAALLAFFFQIAAVWVARWGFKKWRQGTTR